MKTILETKAPAGGARSGVHRLAGRTLYRSPVARRQSAPAPTGWIDAPAGILTAVGSRWTQGALKVDSIGGDRAVRIHSPGRAGDVPAGRIRVATFGGGLRHG